MRFGEPADELRFAIWLRSALFEIGKIFEQVPEQIRIASARLLQGVIDGIRHVLRESEFGGLNVVREGSKPGRRRHRAATDSPLDFVPAVRAVRDDASPS